MILRCTIDFTQRLLGTLHIIPINIGNELLDLGLKREIIETRAHLISRVYALGQGYRILEFF